MFEAVLAKPSVVRSNQQRLLGALRVLAAGWLLLCPTGCSISLSPTATEALGSHHGTQVGGTVRGLVELPRDFQTAVGADVTVDRQLSDNAEGVRGRVGILAGHTSMPERTGPRVGWELLGRTGYLWARIGHPLLDSAFFYGGEFGLPIRLGRTLEPWNADGVVTYDFLLVPNLGVNHLIGISTSSHYLETSVGLSFRLHVDSALLP
jgi:hypothetical protein